MRPINTSVPSPSSTSGIKVWKSPIAYLFGGLALMLVLISVALVILVCSYKKRASHSSDSAEDMKHAMPKNIEINSEPEVLVIMAGDHKPTYLAKPIASSTPSSNTSSSPYCTCGAEAPTSSSSSTVTEQTLTN